MLISQGRISRHFFSLFQFDPLLHCCKVRLWRDGREIHTCLCLAIDILLTPFFFSTPPSPPSLPLSCSCFLSGSLVANPSSRPPLARSGHLISHGFTLSLPPPAACTQGSAPPTHPLILSVFPLLQPHINLASLFTFSTLSPHSEMFAM